MKRFKFLFAFAKEILVATLLKKVDLTKGRPNFPSKANKFVKLIPKIKIYYTDINCRSEIRWEDCYFCDFVYKSLDHFMSIMQEKELQYSMKSLYIYRFQF